MTKSEFVEKLLILGFEMHACKNTIKCVALLDEAELLYDAHFNRRCMYCECDIPRSEAIVLCKSCTE